MGKDISIIVFDFPATELADELQQNKSASTGAFASLSSATKHGEPGSRSISAEAATILVAGVNAVPLLVSSILVFLARKGTGKVEIVSRSGARLAFPYDATLEQVESYREIARAMDIEQIIVSGSDMPGLGLPQREGELGENAT